MTLCNRTSRRIHTPAAPTIHNTPIRTETPRGPAPRFCGLFFAFSCTTGEPVINYLLDRPILFAFPHMLNEDAQRPMPFPAVRTPSRALQKMPSNHRLPPLD